VTPDVGHEALVGLSRTGKSTVAPMLAARRGLGSVDLDAAVAAAAGRSVAEIFAADGEPGFRSLESAALSEALSGPAVVVATGGGGVLDPANRTLLAERATVVWLRAEPVTLVDRLVGSSEERPLLGGGADAALDRLVQMASERGPLYEEVADVAVPVDGKTASEVVDFLDDLLDDLLAAGSDRGPAQ